MVPDSNALYLLGVVTVSAAVTWTLRAAPFALLEPLRENPLLPYLNTHMPAGVMIILVAHSLSSASHASPGAGPLAALAIATVVTAGVHLWRRNFLLSIVVDTGLHVALASTVLAA